jgi:hypothetical protein
MCVGLGVVFRALSRVRSGLLVTGIPTVSTGRRACSTRIAREEELGWRDGLQPKTFPT